MSTFNVQIVTPSGSVYDGPAESITAMGEGGSFGVLANHAPMVAATAAGVLTVRGPEQRFFVVGPGVLEVAGDVVVLAAYAESADNDDDAKAALARRVHAAD